MITVPILLPVINHIYFASSMILDNGLVLMSNGTKLLDYDLHIICSPLRHILLSVITNTTCWWKDHKLEFPRLALCQQGRAFVGYAHLLFGLNKGMWSLGQSSP